MKKSKSLVTVFLAFVLLLSLATGCTQQQGPSDVADPTKEAAAPTGDKQDATEANNEETEPEPVTISLWGAWGEDAGPGETLKQFMEIYPHINVEYVKFKNDDEGNVKINTSLLAGEDVHVFFNYSVSRFAPRVDKELLQDLSTFIERDGFEVTEEFGEGIYNKDGVYYGLPATSLTNSVYINKSMLDTAGLKVPEAWDLETYAQYAKAMTTGSAENKIYGACDFHSNYYWTMPARGLLGSNAWFNDEGLSNFDHPAYKKALEFKYQLENVDQVQYPYADMKATNKQAWHLFMEGKTAMVVASNAMARFLNNPADYPRDFDVVVAPMPTLEKDQDVNYNAGLYYFSYLGMSKNITDAEKEASWLLMKWLTTEGSVNWGRVGHIPSWKKTDKSQLAQLMLGNAQDNVDIDSWKKVVLNYDGASYNDDQLKAYAQVYTILQQEAEKVLFDEVSVDEALESMKTKCDAEINK